MKKKKGFTLVELLAVIVILAVILIIAVPQIMSVIESARKGSIESTAKLIASTADSEYTNRKMLGKDTNIECSEVANLNDKDYGSCRIIFDSTGRAKVSITGKGRFKGYTCRGNSINVECIKEEPIPTDAQYFSYEESYEGVEYIDEVIVKDKDKCVEFFLSNAEIPSDTEKEKLDEFKEAVDTVCSGGEFEGEGSLEDAVRQGIPSSYYESIGLEVTYGISITGYNIEGGLDVVIPSMIDGRKVVSISGDAFTAKNSPDYTGLGITSVVIPSSVTYIGAGAFQNNQLTKITFPLTPIKYACAAFKNNPITNDETYTYPSNVTEQCS